jgi:hypothetical protein
VDIATARTIKTPSCKFATGMKLHQVKLIMRPFMTRFALISILVLFGVSCVPGAFRPLTLAESFWIKPGELWILEVKPSNGYANFDARVELTDPPQSSDGSVNAKASVTPLPSGQPTQANVNQTAQGFGISMFNLGDRYKSSNTIFCWFRKQDGSAGEAYIAVENKLDLTKSNGTCRIRKQ